MKIAVINCAILLGCEGHLDREEKKVEGGGGGRYHFLRTIFSQLVPVCAPTNFLRSPTVSFSLLQRERIKKKKRFGLVGCFAAIC